MPTPSPSFVARALRNAIDRNDAPGAKAALAAGASLTETLSNGRPAFAQAVFKNAPACALAVCEAIAAASLDDKARAVALGRGIGSAEGPLAAVVNQAWAQWVDAKEKKTKIDLRDPPDAPWAPVAAFLLDAKLADPGGELDSDGVSPFHSSVIFGCLRVAEAIGSRLSEPLRQRHDRHGATTVISALRSSSRSVPALSLLLLLGAPTSAFLDPTPFRGRSPLRFAAEEGDAAAVRWLMELGADPDREDADGVWPLSAAASKGCPEAFAALVEGGGSRVASASGQSLRDVLAARSEVNRARDARTLKAELERVDLLLATRGAAPAAPLAAGTPAPASRRL
jgi:hypothetical protein